MPLRGDLDRLGYEEGKANGERSSREERREEDVQQGGR